jgi:hypothetical protein
MKYLPHLSSKKSLFVAVAALVFATSLPPATTHAAACTPPGTDYGTVTFTANISSAGTYRIWTRMSAPNSTDNTYLLDIDSATCYTVGGSTVPTYAGGATTYFANTTANWISRTSGGATIDHPFTSGNHTIKLIGNSSGVVVDRVVITADTTCTPKGVGDNCASIYLAPDINQDGSVGFLDFSALSSKYSQTAQALDVSISTATTPSASSTLASWQASTVSNFAR